MQFRVEKKIPFLKKQTNSQTKNNKAIKSPVHRYYFNAMACEDDLKLGNVLIYFFFCFLNDGYYAASIKVIG